MTLDAYILWFWLMFGVYPTPEEIPPPVYVLPGGSIPINPPGTTPPSSYCPTPLYFPPSTMPPPAPAPEFPFPTPVPIVPPPQ